MPENVEEEEGNDIAQVKVQQMQYPNFKYQSNDYV